MRIRLLMLSMLAIAAVLVVPVRFARGGEPARMTAANLRCEYLHEPLGVEEAAPRLSWELVSDRRGERQTAYQILVASTPERLGRDEGDLWDSTKVEASDTNQIEYHGRPLLSRQACFWKVRSWDRDGVAGAWSPPAHWEMGLLKPEDWSARWTEAKKTPVDLTITSARYRTVDGTVAKDVTEVVAKLVADHGPDFVASNKVLGGDPARDVAKRLTIDLTCRGVPMHVDVAENASVKLPDSQIPYLRKTFTLDKPVKSARLFATALGVYELHLNGRQVGDQLLAPGWTDYNTRLRYQVYDVTSQLASSENALGAIVAPGWYSGHAGLFNAHDYYGTVPALLAQLEITFADGTTQRIVSDESWKTHPGPLLIADIQRGETFDATAAIEGWDTAKLDDASWSAATTRAETRRLQSDISEPVRVHTELAAKQVTEPAPGCWTFDLGQNMVGVVRLKVSAPRGTVLTLRHAEMLNPDGTIYTANLRGASSTDSYVCAGGGVETWQPRFTSHGFRYVELTGLNAKVPPTLDTITGIVFGSDMPAAGEFSCSDARINQLQSNIVWGLRGNYLSIPTDCPQRDERMGWMADAQVFLPTATFNADVAPFMTKWTTDILDAQRDDGAHSDVAPVMKGLNFGTPAWGDAGSIVPWVIYETYGDSRILSRTIESQTRWVEWCRAHSTDLIRDKDRGNDYGDWLSIKADTPKDLIGTAYFARSTDILARSLRVLGRTGDAEKYERLLADIKTAFNRKYVATDGRIHGNTQSCYILALEFDLLPADMRAKAIQYLEDDIKAKDGHLSTGFVGVSHLLPVLTAGGKPEIAYRLLMQDSFPSWLFSVKHGATTIWERWDGWTPETGVHPDFGMNSFNHYSLGSCGRWLFESVAGIARDPARPGFERIIIRPQPTESLSFAKATFHSIRGPITSAWKRGENGRTFELGIPANTQATVYLPAEHAELVTESGKPLSKAGGVRVLRQEGRELVLEVGSGTYSFVVAARR
jgi:alpha-L-rhamnosidase